MKKLAIIILICSSLAYSQSKSSHWRTQAALRDAPLTILTSGFNLPANSDTDRSQVIERLANEFFGKHTSHPKQCAVIIENLANGSLPIAAFWDSETGTEIPFDDCFSRDFFDLYTNYPYECRDHITSPAFRLDWLISRLFDNLGNPNELFDDFLPSGGTISPLAHQARSRYLEPLSIGTLTEELGLSLEEFQNSLVDQADKWSFLRFPTDLEELQHFRVSRSVFEENFCKFEARLTNQGPVEDPETKQFSKARIEQISLRFEALSKYFAHAPLHQSDEQYVRALPQWILEFEKVRNDLNNNPLPVDFNKLTKRLDNVEYVTERFHSFLKNQKVNMHRQIANLNHLIAAKEKDVLKLENQKLTSRFLPKLVAARNKQLEARQDPLKKEMKIFQDKIDKIKRALSFTDSCLEEAF